MKLKLDQSKQRHLISRFRHDYLLEVSSIVDLLSRGSLFAIARFISVLLEGQNWTECYCPLEYRMLQFVRYLLRFRGNVLHPSSDIIMNIYAARASKT
jgi:hypothetical protein